MVSLVTGACRDLKWDKLIKNPRSKNDTVKSAADLVDFF